MIEYFCSLFFKMTVNIREDTIDSMMTSPTGFVLALLLTGIHDSKVVVVCLYHPVVTIRIYRLDYRTINNRTKHQYRQMTCQHTESFIITWPLSKKNACKLSQLSHSRLFRACLFSDIFKFCYSLLPDFQVFMIRLQRMSSVFFPSCLYLYTPSLP